MSAGDGASSTAARKKRASWRPRWPQPSAVERGTRRTEGAQDDEDDDVPELPDRPMEGQIHDPEVAERVLVPRKPQIGDTMPAPDAARQPTRRQRPRRPLAVAAVGVAGVGGSGAKPGQPVTADLGDSAFEVDEETLARQRGRERKGRPIGRYLMCVHVRPGATQIAVLEGRSLIEHYVSKPADDPTQIHGNIYLGRVQNVLPGMEAAFVDIGTPKNAVLYRGDLQYDQEDIVEKGANAAHRADPEGPSDDRLPGHEEPDRRQGRAAHARGVAARAIRRPHPELEHLRHLEAPATTTSASGSAASSIG